MGMLIPMRNQNAGGLLYNPVTALGSDLLAYWDADSRYWGALGAMTIATGVSSWKDIVAGYDATQATGTVQPIFSATSFNGSPAVTFDGTDDQLTCLDAALLAALPTAAGASELWILFQDASSSGARYFASYGFASASSRAVGALAGRGRGLVGDGTTANAINGASVDVTVRSVERLIIAGGAQSLVVNGTQDATGTFGLATINTRLRLGCIASGASFGQGPLAAALFTLPLSAEKASGLQGFLMGRRNL